MKLKSVLFDIDDLLVEGLPVEQVATILKVPVQWVLDREQELIGASEPRFCGSDYDEVTE